MTTATPIKPVPNHVRSVAEMAEGMGWDVHFTPVSAKFTPPKGVKLKQFSISLTTPPAVPQLKKMLSDNGFATAAAAWKRRQGEQSEQPSSARQEEEPTQPAKPADAPELCPECVAAGAEHPYKGVTSQGLGSHRRKAHGVLGTSADSLRRRQASARKASAKKTPAKKTPPKAVKAPVPPQRAETTPQTSVQVNTELLPKQVADAASTLLTAFKETSDSVSALREENEALRRFRDQVFTLASDGTKAPVQVVASILDLAKASDQA